MYNLVVQSKMCLVGPIVEKLAFLIGQSVVMVSLQTCAQISLRHKARPTISETNSMQPLPFLLSSYAPHLLFMQKAGRKKSTEDTENLYRSLGDFGDHELVLSGVHQNMLTRSFLDTRMALTCKVFDQIYAADSLMTAVRHNMDFSLQSYLPAAILGIRAVVASPDR